MESMREFGPNQLRNSPQKFFTPFNSLLFMIKKLYMGYPPLRTLHMELRHFNFLSAVKFIFHLNFGYVYVYWGHKVGVRNSCKVLDSLTIK